MEICSGADHVIHKYPVASCSLWASTDIKLTISPTVVVLRASLLIVNACNDRNITSSSRFSVYLQIGQQTLHLKDVTVNNSYKIV